MNPKLHLKLEILDKESGDLLCGCGCGTVIQERTPTLEPDYISDEKKNTRRTGSQLTKNRHDMGLSSIIGKSDIDHTASKISGINSQLFYKLRKMDNWSNVKGKDNENQRMIKGIEYIVKFCDQLMYPDVIQQNAIDIFRKAVINNLTYHRTTDHFAAVSILLACRQINKPVTAKELINKLQLKSKLFFQYHRVLHDNLPGIESRPIDPRFYIRKMIENYRLRSDFLTISNKILEILESENYTIGKKPDVLAGSIILIINRTKHSHKKLKDKFSYIKLSEISMFINFSETTLSNHIKEINDILQNRGFKIGN